MSQEIFCTKCAKPLNLNQTHCDCGNSISPEEKSALQSVIQDINHSSVLVNPEFKYRADDSMNTLINGFKLEGLYFSSTSAQKDFERKVEFMKEDLLPIINNWSDSLSQAEKEVAKDKVKIYSRIIEITDFAIKEFFGPLKVKEKGFENFLEFQDFSKYKISETMFESKLDFSDLKTVNLGTVSTNVMNTIGDTLRYGSFNEISKKSSWSDSDIKTVKTELGVAVAAQLIGEIANKIGQTQEVIKNVRSADKDLNEKIEHISNVVNSFKIEEEEIEKQKKLFSKNDVILDFCIDKYLKPIAKELRSNQIFKDYRNARIPYDKEQEIIEIDKEVLDTNIKVSFWSCLLKNKKEIFTENWNRRLDIIGKKVQYYKLFKSLNSNFHDSLEKCNNYQMIKLNEFKEFENEQRKILRKLPIISENRETVKAFAGVLSYVKSNIIN